MPPSDAAARTPPDAYLDPLAAFDDLTFTLPPSWTKRTIVTFTAPRAREDGYPATVVVMREPMAEGETLAALVERDTLDFGESVLVGPPFMLDGRSAHAFSCQWETPTGVMYQESTLVETHLGAERFVTRVTATCAEEDADEMHLVYARLFESMRFEQVPDPRGPRRPSSQIRAAIPEVPIPGVRSRR